MPIAAVQQDIDIANSAIRENILSAVNMPITEDCLQARPGLSGYISSVRHNVSFQSPTTQITVTLPTAYLGTPATYPTFGTSLDSFVGSKLTQDTVDSIAQVIRNQNLFYNGTSWIPTSIRGNGNSVNIQYETTGNVSNLLYSDNPTITGVTPTSINAFTNNGGWIHIDTVDPETAWINSIKMEELSKQNFSSLLKNEIKSNLLIKSSRKRTNLNPIVTPQEIKARETLRDLITEKDWRRYLTNGFVMIKGQSNKWYQIFNNQSRTKVYEKGKLLAEICIHTEGNCPPTDHILNIMCLVQYDEDAVWKGGNITWRNNNQNNPFATVGYSTVSNNIEGNNLVDKAFNIKKLLRIAA